MLLKTTPSLLPLIPSSATPPHPHTSKEGYSGWEEAARGRLVDGRDKRKKDRRIFATLVPVYVNNTRIDTDENKAEAPDG